MIYAVRAGPTCPMRRILEVLVRVTQIRHSDADAEGIWFSVA